jgi:hypothetical protein
MLQKNLNEYSEQNDNKAYLEKYEWMRKQTLNWAFPPGFGIFLLLNLIYY